MPWLIWGGVWLAASAASWAVGFFSGSALKNLIWFLAIAVAAIAALYVWTVNK